jgi:hypothetical protein
MRPTVDGVWADLHERVGDDLRAVTRYESREFETRMREDVRERYTDDEDRAIVDDVIVRQLGLLDTERRFDAGRLEANVNVFEHAWVIAWPDGLPSKSGFIVSIQRGGDATTIEDVEACIGYLNEEVRPTLGEGG